MSLRSVVGTSMYVCHKRPSMLTCATNSGVLHQHSAPIIWHQINSHNSVLGPAVKDEPTRVLSKTAAYVLQIEDVAGPRLRKVDSGTSCANKHHCSGACTCGTR